MVGTSQKQVFKPFPTLIKFFMLLLKKIGYLTTECIGFGHREEFAQEFGDKYCPRSDRTLHIGI
jgi:hypothetical protein